MWEAPTLRRCGVKREAGSSHGQLEQAKPTHTKNHLHPSSSLVIERTQREIRGSSIVLLGILEREEESLEK